MGLPVTVYRWDDAGAPQILTQKPSEVITVLKKCLVDGYGAKLPLGWTKEFENTATQSVAFRNNPTTGSGGYFQIWSHDGLDNTQRLMRIKSAQSMSGLDVFYKESYLTCIHPSQSTWTKWVLIGTSTGFYLIIGGTNLMGGNNTIYDTMCFIGDIDSFVPADQSRFLAVGQTGNNYDYTSTSANAIASVFSGAWRLSGGYSNSANNILFRMFGATGGGASVDYGLTTPFANFFTAPARGLLDRNMGLMVPTFISIFSLVPNSASKDPDGIYYSQSYTYPMYRGKLPGLINEVFGRKENLPWPVIETLNGHSHWLLRSTGGVQFTWINMEEW
ncbi:hypothetical protein [Shewanella baltica]|uniref:hypothetical protein n=1 Tax=Shewanella baltica TaxID=62322 RepID=UPI00217D1BCF|nr:hypothetical protein [Shewanella baltica]MCS6241486.1 hypothetical protein [Shewanella baltica]